MYVLCVMMISLDGYTLCVIMTSLQVWRFTSVYVVCDDDTLKVRKFASLHISCDDDKLGSLEGWKSTYCV